MRVPRLSGRQPERLGQLAQRAGEEGYLSKNTRCSIFTHIIISPFIIISGFHFSMMARFKMKLRLNALALCAIAMILMAQVRGSVRYESRSPRESYPNECFLLPQRTQSTPSSSSSHREQNCCMQTRLGTCSFAASVYQVFWFFSKS